ncbi:MAG: hypothetical protein ACOYB1_17390 [Limnohabitans sp.]
MNPDRRPQTADRRPSLPIPIITGLALPALVLFYFYITYAYGAWFWQDDFGFIAHYANSIQWNQLFDFTNFGRFLSRNGYWHWGIKYFSYNAQFFYIFNFFIILCSCLLLYKIFEKYGRLNGFIAGLFYFLLPATVDSYAWLSNSQHILGHFFVLLFVYLFTKDIAEKSRAQEFTRTLQLLVILILGFTSNVFMSMVVSLPAWMILINKEYRRSKTAYFTVGFSTLLFALFFFKLSGNQTGAYSTSYTIETLAKNLDFYFSSGFFATIWIVSIVFGTIYAIARKNYLASWLFIASSAFFLPFAFFVHQRYVQYGALTYLFFLLGIWLLLIESKLKHRPNLVSYVGLAIVILLFSKSLEPPIRYFSDNPRGAEQKQQIQFLKVFNSQNPNIKNYCFRSNKKVENTTGVKEWDIPGDWWFVGFGKAFTLFVSHEKTYELIQDAARCDVVFVFKEGRLEVTDQ